MQKKDWLCVGLGIIVIVLSFVVFNQKHSYKDAIDTKDHFVNSLHSCLEDKQSLINKDNKIVDFFRGKECKNRTLAGYNQFDIDTLNWIEDGYQCDIHRITSEEPSNANINSRWNSSIECYKCPEVNE